MKVPAYLGSQLRVAAFAPAAFASCQPRVLQAERSRSLLCAGPCSAGRHCRAPALGDAESWAEGRPGQLLRPAQFVSN